VLIVWHALIGVDSHALASVTRIVVPKASAIGKIPASFLMLSSQDS
jgi:hypothetical protein